MESSIDLKISSRGDAFVKLVTKVCALRQIGQKERLLAGCLSGDTVDMANDGDQRRARLGRLATQDPLHGGLSNAAESGENEYVPVLLFDKQSAGSNSQIELLTIPEVAKLLKISVSGVRRLYQERRLPFVRVGGSVRFIKNDIVSYLARQRVEPVG